MMPLILLHVHSCDGLGCDVEKARSSPATVEVSPAEEVFLSVTSYLSRRPALDKVSRDPFPISFAYFFQTKQEPLVLIFSPCYSSFPLAVSGRRNLDGVIGGGVSGGGGGGHISFSISDLGDLLIG